MQVWAWIFEREGRYGGRKSREGETMEHRFGQIKTAAKNEQQNPNQQEKLVQEGKHLRSA